MAPTAFCPLRFLGESSQVRYMLSSAVNDIVLTDEEPALGVLIPGSWQSMGRAIKELGGKLTIPRSILEAVAEQGRPCRSRLDKQKDVVRVEDLVRSRCRFGDTRHVVGAICRVGESGLGRGHAAQERPQSTVLTVVPRKRRH